MPPPRSPLASLAPVAGLLLAVGCRGAAPSHPAPSSTGGTGASAAPMFDGLFQPGTTWRFAITSEHSYGDDQDPAADARGMVMNRTTSSATCRVERVVRFPGGRASDVTCDEDTDRRFTDGVAAVWIQTADGLWRDSILPDEGVAPDLDPAVRLLPARPVAGEQRDEDPESEDGPAGGSGSTTIISGADGDWCVEWASWGGDESWSGVCLDARGVVSGSHGFAGGEVIELRFERVEP